METQKVYTAKFWLLSLSAFLFITSFNLLVPELPLMVEAYGGTWERGLPLMLFALAALISRPFSGKLVDLIGRKPIIMIGGIVCVVLGIVYQFADGLWVFLTLRFLHGFSTGFTPVGNMSYLADICPPHRRGEAMGIIGMAASLGFPVGQTLGTYITTEFDWNMLFYASSACALLSVTLVSTFRETLPNPQKFKLGMLNIKRDEIFDKGLMVPFAAMTLIMFSFGTFNIIIYSQALSLGFAEVDKAIYLTIYACTSLLFRYPSGRLSDRYGRRNVLIVGVSFGTLAILFLAFAETKSMLIASGVLYGIASGLNSPTIFAWAVDLSSKGRVGRGMSTMFIGIEIGIMLGALYAGVLTSENKLNFAPVHITSAALCLTALIILLRSKRDKPITAPLQQDT